MKFKVFTFTQDEPIEITAELAQSDPEYIYFANEMTDSDTLKTVAVFSRVDFRYFLAEDDGD